MNKVVNPSIDSGLGDPSELITQTIEIPPVNNRINYWMGLILMIINKIRHSIAGYTSTRGFSDKEVEKAVNHNWNIVKRYYSYLNDYDSKLHNDHFNGKRVLELGIGSDIGTALIGTALGAKEYIGFDVFDLAKDAPQHLYNELLKKLEKFYADPLRIHEAKRQLNNWQNGKSSSLQYIVDPNFQLDSHGLSDIDYIVSNAAVQQFSDVDRTVSEMHKIMKPGGIFISLIDLSTHTRWIGQRDPFNLYRYPNWLYGLLKFKGSPNRLRSEDYQKIFEKHGWTNIRIYNRISANHNYVNAIKPSFSAPYNASNREMNALTIIVCATKQ